MSATVGGNVPNSGGISETVGGGMSTMGEMSATVREIEYGLGNLTVEIVNHNFDRLPFRVHGVTCKKPIRI